jgi:hypothetical protein
LILKVIRNHKHPPSGNNDFIQFVCGGILMFMFCTMGCSDSGEEIHLRVKNIDPYSIRKNFLIQSSNTFPDSLAPVYPNPYNHNSGDSSVALFFTLRDTGAVKIIIQNPIGDSIAIFRDSLLPPGSFTGFWNPVLSDGTRLRPGLYFITMRVAPNNPDRNYINSKLLQIQSND